MSTYDMIQINCYYCRKCIGEIEYDSKVRDPICGVCDSPAGVSIIRASLNTKALTLYKKEFGMD